MTEQRKYPIILVMTAVFTRSEEHPLAPLLKIMKKTQDIKVDILDLTDVHDRLKRIAMMEFSLTHNRPDIVLCGFDRPEMVDLAYCAYHHNIPVCQIFAGDIAGGAFDDADRFVISTYASLILVSDIPQFERIQKSFQWRGLLQDRPMVATVGATHFDDMEYNEPELGKNERYALVLYNPPSKGDVLNQLYADLDEISKRLMRFSDKGIINKVYWVAPNGDYGSDVIINHARGASRRMRLEYLGELKHKDFLGYLQGAKMVVGNSSSMYYEGAYFNIPIEQIGQRNKYREKISENRREKGASHKIIEQIRLYLEVRG